ncbi:microsomal glutathione S-transferase 1-like isoform X1 [Macrosteles quadrilineatus]|uniref:microsomal glutathione S-transferase 1-like isoform X1 n=1 Tax=Macrosteles quadrilineatus TaxID=74068 RepID=UPI0023E2AC02|nr:microsomal glutathione S-transferase 1-like isoform X1 [Macrosteles quadrilineatus]
MNFSLSIFSYDNQVLQGYAFYAAILMLKTLLMAPLTAFQRFRKKAFISPEDAAAFKGEVKTEDPDVERVRRAHLNDLENIPIFLVTGLLFVMSDPDVVVALMFFRLYTLARFAHTFVYAIYVVRQPARAIAFGVGQIITTIMIIMIIVKFHQL